MAYRVDYQRIRKIRGAEKRRCTIPAVTAIFFCAFLILVYTYWPRGTQVLQGLLFSGDRAITEAAVEAFAQDLGEGESLYTALQEFCRTIMHHAS